MSTSLKVSRRAFSSGAASVALMAGIGRAKAAKDFTIGVVNPLTGFGADLGICAQQALEVVVSTARSRAAPITVVKPAKTELTKAFDLPLLGEHQL